jgi:hypothetical protein
MKLVQFVGLLVCGMLVLGCEAASNKEGGDVAGQDSIGGQDLLLDGNQADGVDAGLDTTVPQDGATDDDTTAPPAQAELIYKTCSFVAACLGDSRISLYAGNCYKDLYMHLSMSPDPKKEYDRLVECAQTATTCADFVACDQLGVTYDCQSPSDGACVGEALVECLSSSEIRRIYDCQSADGMTCVQGKGCTTGTQCPVGPQTSICDGNTLVNCDSAEEGWEVWEKRYDCPEGSTCIMISPYPQMPAFGGCYRNTVTVETCIEAATCNGDTMKSCGMGVEMTVDCAAFDRTCTTTPNLACAPLANQCVPRQSPGYPEDAYQDNCEGSTLKTCMNGRIIEIDCGTLGATGSCALAGTLQGDLRGVCN